VICNLGLERLTFLQLSPFIYFLFIYRWLYQLKISDPTFARSTVILLKGTVSQDFLLHESSSSKPLKKTKGHVEFFAEIFANQGASPVSTTLMGKLPPVSTTPAANLPPVSTTPVAICHRYQRHMGQILPPMPLV
jgi:hypothetical protein